MIKLLTHPQDPRYIFMTSDAPAELSQLEKHLNKIPTYMLLPTFRGIPKAEAFLNKFRGRDGSYVYFCAAGLWKEIIDFLTTKKIPYDASAIDSSFKYTKFNMSLEEYTAYIKSWEMNIEPRDYQIKAAWMILHYNLSLSELSTRSGKTLIFNMLARSAKELLGAKKILMIVPSIHLVKQGVKDLQEYKEYFRTEQIWANGEEVSMADLTIGTFQSLVRKADPRYKNYDPHFFDDYDVVCVDEAHKATCRSISTILTLDAFKKLKLRFGFTGTLPKPNTIEWFACQAILGPKIQEISARELIESGYLADPIIKQFRLQYDPNSLTDITNHCGEYLLSTYITENGSKVLLPVNQRAFTMIHEKRLPVALSSSKSLLSPEEYKQYIISMCGASSRTLNLEQLITMFSAERLELISQLISNLDKNVIVFAHNTEYINFLEKYLKHRHPDRSIYKMTGSTSLKKRQQTLDALLESNNNIIIGSFGVIGTGLTIKNIDYGIFAQSFKADTINRQSLGRLMLRTKDKTEFYLYDIIDCYPTKKIYNQGLEKIKIYKSEGHRHEIVNKPCEFRAISPEDIEIYSSAKKSR